MDEKMHPKIDYYVDKSDPDIVVLRRQEGSFVAAFSARGATREGIVEAAKEDYGKLVGAPPPSRPDLRTYRIGTSRDPTLSDLRLVFG
jgi:hypothetical protein